MNCFVKRVCNCASLHAGDWEVASDVPYPGGAEIEAVIFGSQPHPLHSGGQWHAASLCHRD